MESAPASQGQGQGQRPGPVCRALPEYFTDSRREGAVTGNCGRGTRRAMGKTPRRDRNIPSGAGRGRPNPARKFHRFPAVDADLTAFAALNAARVLNVLSSTPARPDSRSPCENTPSLRSKRKLDHLRALASRIGEIFGLAGEFRVGAGSI